MRSPRSGGARAAAAACAAATVTALFALSAPAYADPDASSEPAASEAPADPAPADPDVKPMATGADLSVKVRSSESTPGGAANVRKMITVEVKNKGPEPAKDPVVSFTVKDYDPTDGYTLTGAGRFCNSDPDKPTGDVVFTCSLGEPGYTLASGGVSNLAMLQIEHAIGAEGDVVEGVVSVESETPDDKPDNNSAPFTVTIVDAGVDVSAYMGNDVTIDPGKTGSFAGDDFVQVYNEGNTPVKGISLSLTLPAYASFEKDYSNCEYSADGRKANCSYDFALEENQDGFAIGADTPFRITVAKNAPGPMSIGDATATAAALGVLEPQVMRGMGNGQRLEATADEQDDQAPGDNAVNFAVFTTANPADVKVTAAEAEGKVGATVSVVVAVGNNGPADSPGGAEVTFTAPKGTTVVSGPDDCKEQSKGVWVCTTDATIPVGKENKGTFKLKIDGGTVEDGKVEAVGRFADTDDKNNAAAVVVNVLSGGGGGLPVTGQNLTIAGIAAAVLLAVGGALVLLGRRRRAAVADGPSDGADAPPAAGDSAEDRAADAEEAAEEAEAHAVEAAAEAAAAASDGDADAEEKAAVADEAAADAEEKVAAAEEAEAEAEEAAAETEEAKAEGDEPEADGKKK